MNHLIMSSYFWDLSLYIYLDSQFEFSSWHGHAAILVIFGKKIYKFHIFFIQKIPQLDDGMNFYFGLEHHTVAASFYNYIRKCSLKGLVLFLEKFIDHNFLFRFKQLNWFYIILFIPKKDYRKINELKLSFRILLQCFYDWETSSWFHRIQTHLFFFS